MSGGEWLPIGCKKTRSLLKEAVESIGQASKTTSADSSPGPSALPSALMEHRTYQNSNTPPYFGSSRKLDFERHTDLEVGAKPPPKPKPTWQSSSRLEKLKPTSKCHADLETHPDFTTQADFGSPASCRLREFDAEYLRMRTR